MKEDKNKELKEYLLAKIKEYTIQYIKAALPPAITEWRQRKTDAPKLKHWLKKIYEEK